MLTILDVSEIQARRPDPQVREVSRLTWERASIPPNAIPFTREGKPYVLGFDEYTDGTSASGGDPHAVGAARIIDIAVEQHPRVVSNLRLQVNNPAEHEAASDDPGAFSPVQGYAAHYCNIPTRVDPKDTVVVLSNIEAKTNSGSDVKLPGVEVWRMSDGLAQRVQSLIDTAELKAALG